MSKNNKNKGKAVQKSPLGPTKYVQQYGRSLQLDKCYLNVGWKSQGMASIFVVRRKQSGKIIFGSYLIDIFCLGLKDTYFEVDFPEARFEDMIESASGEIGMEAVDPDLVFNIIYGGIEYAEDLGFEPHKDFKITEFLLPPVEDVPFIPVDFGQNGRPYFYAGPHDNIPKIKAILDKSVGPGAYGFMVRLG
jgi:hypothetical protein